MLCKDDNACSKNVPSRLKHDDANIYIYIYL